MKTLPPADGARLDRWINGIDQFNDTVGDGTTRHYMTATECACREYIRDEMEKLGLRVEVDCMGNVHGTLAGTEPDLAPVWTGSHFDTVLHGGRFDGVAGVVTGMEALYLIASSGAAHRRDLTVIAYGGEEPARFGIGCIGSRAMAGRLTVEDLKALRDLDGTVLYDEMKLRGFDPDAIGTCRRKAGDVFCSLELHIEQNKVLEEKKLSLGIVKAICSALNFVVTVTGQAAHAGGMPMKVRKDAYAAACEMSLALERMVRENRLSEYCTGTVGYVQLSPNAPNIIPGQVQFTVDIRDCNAASKDALMAAVQEEFRKIAEKRGVGVQLELQNNDKPVVSDPALMAALEQHAAARGYETCELISGPFHDSLFLGTFTPVGMLFVPSKAGLSHCPEEWTDTKDLKAGAEVLADALLDVANRDTL